MKLQEKREEFFKENNTEFEETNKFLNEINLDEYLNGKDRSKLYILWSPANNPCFDFMTIKDKELGLYQIKISIGIKEKLDETFFGELKIY